MKPHSRGPSSSSASSYHSLCGSPFAPLDDLRNRKSRLVIQIDWGTPPKKATTATWPSQEASDVIAGRHVHAIEDHRKRVWFFCTVDLVNALEVEKQQGNSGQITARLAHSDLVILNELGYLPFSSSGGTLLFYLLSKLDARSEARR